MKRIAVMSDTHWGSWEPERESTAQLISALEAGYDEIWHGGDVVCAEVLEQLESFCPVVVVKGNCDGGVSRSLPHAVIETIEDVRIGMIHGWDVPLGHTAALVERFPSDVDIIIHGHTHLRRQEEFTGDRDKPVTILNPGSVSSHRGGETPGMAELVINGKEWDYRIIPF